MTRRQNPRRRTRLRSGRIADTDNRFIVDCQIVNRSESGVRLRLVEMVEVPVHLHFYDDELDQAFVAELVWRDGRDAGIRYREEEVPDGCADDGIRHPLAGPFYALHRRG